ncbi:valine--tRNA ligase [Xanthocytophaga flava]|uniref:valine--tRNA ligase n=1 Tax=Xanthocytophaga flava TaxID=3048013 RepID=UPI0028D30FA7|nr:valine--tRNA ligase [Xanthocytophaga flavus]MDJ1470922.1 valine--tRNA ligase [Xanthocytophaga flavus]
MEIAKNYDPKNVEDKWYQYWLEHKFFAAKPNPEKEPYCIVIPPPNVTGKLHMGHMLNNTIQDILVRRARMQGKEACWVPGTDHASIATEAKVVGMLREKGIDKKSITRDEFLKYAWEWKETYGGIILEQLKKLGASCDWDRTRFTMEPSLSEAVIDVFVDLYNKGKIYRAYRMVNWDPKGKTALSDEEVIHKESQSKLYYIKYPIAGSASDFVTIATTRPETILADTAICVNPNDERYVHLHGKKVIVPFVNREIPVIADEYVTMDFGTGALKVTPAHDLNDYELGKKYDLPVIDILNDDGTLNERSGIAEYVGKDRFTIRKQIAKDLEAAGYLEKIEEYKSNVGYSERNPDTVVEPKVSLQWWLKMDELAKPALENVLNDTIQFHPARFKNTYRNWMENIQDWCISRQLWWGQRIPAWYDKQGNFVVAKNHEEALKLYKTQYPGLAVEELSQDEDVLDTWFSSWLWPISVFDGLKDPNNEDIQYFYPTNDLVTGPDIIFFWVARMIVSGYEYRHEAPFKNVYFTGIIRDQYGRKMAKQLGNSPDPIALMERYGADGVRTGLLFSSPAGNDLIFDTPVPKSNDPEVIAAFLADKSNDVLASKLCDQGSRFNNKIWNAFRLVKGWELDSVIDNSLAPTAEDLIAIQWFKARFNQKLAEIEGYFADYRISDALLAVYDLAWTDFCSWYLEMVKPEFGEKISGAVFKETVAIFDQLLRVVHPFMPFITEEIWQMLVNQKEGDSICIAAYPKTASFDSQLIEDAIIAQEVISQIRNIRNNRGMSPKTALPLSIRTQNQGVYTRFGKLIQKLANVSELTFTDTKVDDALSFIVKTDECFVTLEEKIDVDAEIAKAEKELAEQQRNQNSSSVKLSNERFVANAKPEVVETERKKLADAEAKIKALEERLDSLRKMK